MYLRPLFILALFLFFSHILLAGISPAETSPTIFQHLVNQQITQITIHADFTTLIAEKKKPLSFDAIIVLANDQGFEEKMDIKVEVRGRNRRRVCAMPPLRLDFSKKDLSEIGLNEMGDKLKLVTHCKDEYGGEYLLKEYWSYRLYNELTPFSFRVHRIKIRYQDTSSPEQEAEERVAFLIESEEELAARFDAVQEDVFGLMSDKVDRETYHHNLLFQYMIGNDDWGLTNPRNLTFLVPNNGNSTMVVPYDFDFSGLVDAPYAVPNPNFGAKSVLDRVSLGHFSSKEELYATIDAFLQRKDLLLSCFWDGSWLSKAAKKDMRKYLKGFFKEVLNKKKMEDIFLTGP